MIHCGCPAELLWPMQSCSTLYSKRILHSFAYLSGCVYAVRLLVLNLHVAGWGDSSPITPVLVNQRKIGVSV